MTYEDIAKVNAGLAQVDIKGKQYVTVAQRIKGFRQLYPEGMIETEIKSLQDGVVVIVARIYEHTCGNLLATGTACEERQSSYINKTSYIENCETSAVGRALGFLGIGIDTDIASAEELAGALQAQQEEKERQLTEEPWQIRKLRGWCAAHNVSSTDAAMYKAVAVEAGVIPPKGWTELTEREFTSLLAFAETQIKGR